MSVEREMTLQEWVERLPPIHAARKEYQRLIAQKSEPYEYLQETVKELKAMSDNWEEAARRHCSNEFFYRELLDECAAHLGPDVYVSDDGSVQDEPLRLKIPELVKQLVERITDLEAQRDALLEAAREAKALLDYATYHDGRYEQCASTEKFQLPAYELSKKIAALLPPTQEPAP